MSGWWPSASARSAALLTKAKASAKSLNGKRRSMRLGPSRTVQSGLSLRCASISSRVSGGTPQRHGVQVLETSGSDEDMAGSSLSSPLRGGVGVGSESQARLSLFAQPVLQASSLTPLYAVDPH